MPDAKGKFYMVSVMRRDGSSRLAETQATVSDLSEDERRDSELSTSDDVRRFSFVATSKTEQIAPTDVITHRGKEYRVTGVSHESPYDVPMVIALAAHGTR